MHFKGYEEFVSRVIDMKEQAIRSQRVIFTPFLNEHEQEIVHKVASECFLYESGGYENAERKRIAISGFQEEYIYYPLQMIKTKFNPTFDHIDYSDVLGALMHMGIDRNRIGDILVLDKEIIIIVSEDIQEYIMQQLVKIKRCNVHFEPMYEEIQYERKIDFEPRIVSSLRLDAIVSSIIHTNREKAKAFIKGGNIKVNQVVLEENNHLCNNNDVISIRHHGRFLIKISDRRTKKDRIVIEVGKYV